MKIFFFLSEYMGLETFLYIYRLLPLTEVFSLESVTFFRSVSSK